MQLLLDTNVFIPLEPTAGTEFETGTGLAADLLRTAGEVGAKVFLHPVQRRDLAQDRDLARRERRELLFRKYVELDGLPEASKKLLDVFGNPGENTNDWVDCHLLAAVERSAVSLLVTEDKQLRKRAAQVGLATRCLGLEDALALLRAERIRIPPTQPSVVALKAYELEDRDPIFDSLRARYEGFDDWLQKCRAAHRQCWVVRLGARPEYAGIAIVDPQDPPSGNLETPCLKICTFKIGDKDTGYRLGELLLRAVFDYAHQNNYASAFIESGPRQTSLFYLLWQFGFEEMGSKSEDSPDIVLGKRFRPSVRELTGLSPVEVNRRFGPFVVSAEGVSSYVVPIEPDFHDALFPDLAGTPDFWSTSRPYSNAMRKAYLCNSAITTISPGDLLWFYRSRDLQSVTALGMVKATRRTSDASGMARFLGNRTVYPEAQIQGKCAGREALGIRFRRVPLVVGPLSLKELIDRQVLKSAPQSITKLSTVSHQWLLQKLS